MESTTVRPAKQKVQAGTTPDQRAKDVAVPHRATFRSAFGLALAGGVLLWAAFPPLGLWPLAWLAPLPWLWLIALPQPLERKSYVAIWLASFLFWAALLQGLRLAHPALYAGWLVLAAYLGVYLPLFVGMSRMLIHRWRWPLAVAAPLTWVGLEFARAYVATGFAAAMLSQTQAPWPLVLQTADIFGAYGPSFLMMLVTVAVAVWFLPSQRRERVATTTCAAAVLLTALAYGGYRMQQAPVAGPSVRVMLVQGSVDTKLDGNPENGRDMLNHYRDLTLESLAQQQQQSCDLVVWPESSFGEYWQMEVDDPNRPPKRISADQYREAQEGFALVLSDYAARLNARTGSNTHFLVGGNTLHFHEEGMEVSNAAFLISPQGDLSGRYFKNHLVMCGEYMPFGEWFPAIYKLVPIQGVKRGREFVSFDIAGLKFAPNICFESVMPQVLLRQHNELASRGEEPDVLINTTNDGWFYGSSILDIHFQCAVLRAIENRKPFLIAANTGISGVIDGNGRVLQRGPTRNTAVLVAEVQPDGRQSWFHTLGDWPAGACLLVCSIAAAWGLKRAKPQE